MPAEVLNLVGIDIRRSHLNRRRQVEDDRVLLGRLPLGLDGLTDLDGKVETRVAERLRAELEGPVGALLGGVVLGQRPDQPRTLLDQLDALLLGKAKDDAPEALAGGKVYVDDGLLGALEGLDRSADEVLAAGGQDLQVDIVWYGAGGLDQTSGEVEVGLGGRGEGDFDLFVAEVAEHLEVGPFLVAILVRGEGQSLAMG